MRALCVVTAFLFALTASAGRQAMATVTYSVEFSSSTITGGTGSPWSVNVVLRESYDPNTDTPMLATLGVFTAGFEVALSAANDTVVNGATGNPAFDTPPNLTFDSTSASVFSAQLFGNPLGVTGAASGLTTNDLIIGSVSGTFGTSNNSLALLPTTDLFFTDTSNNVLSVVRGGNLDLVVTAVPEPSSALLSICGVAVMALVRSRRRVCV